MALESGVVVAILILAVVVVDRLGGTDELARRYFQIALGISLVFLVLSATNAFVRVDGADGVTFLGVETAADSEGSNRIAIATAINYAAGVLLFLIGLSVRRNFHTIPLGIMLGGLLLILVSGSLGLQVQYQLVQGILASSENLDLVTFLVAAGGTGALSWYGFKLEAEYEAAEGGDPQIDSAESDE